ncbi:pilus assembly protein TadG-related protein [Solicola gregarius]|uniref:Pilus assembly protein TadG-related protein n=1 Tax=Solicola gregarius TaxID=2908642 RepID=A0AA46YK27_9ACTN|nr:pilus assembly protein TadG-related protein [Solicola gregarius]UYM04076.1 pilus assembly protein TadG-related protein [Solicola gregarius]
MRRRTDRGQVGVMIIGFFALASILMAVVVDVSSAYLRRTAMNNIADGAALAAADAVQGEQVYASGLGEEAPIDAVVAGEYVSAYLADCGAIADYPGLRWRVEQDGDQIRVRVSAPLDLPLRVAGWGDGVTVAGEASVLVRVS